MDLEAIAEAIYERLSAGVHDCNPPWENEDDSEFRIYFVTGTRNAAVWLSITEEGIRLLAKTRDNIPDENGMTRAQWRFRYLNTLKTAKRAAARVAAGE